MRKIVYYVAASVDGFIAGADDDISGFIQQGEGIDQYLLDLQHFDTVIIGRKTYAFGYKFGLQPGQPAYPLMEHYIFSNTLTFDHPHGKVHVSRLEIEKIKALKNEVGSDIYLCGGGQLAGWLLDHQMIDTLKIKLNPLVLGQGVRLLGASQARCQLTLKAHETFDDGLQIITYTVSY